MADYRFHFRYGFTEEWNEEATKRFNRENRPVIPHIFYKDHMMDLLEDHQGWINLAKSKIITN